MNPEFLVINDFFMIFLKKGLFSTFSDIFENNRLQTNIIVCVLFYVNMQDQTQLSLNSPFFLQLFFQDW